MLTCFEHHLPRRVRFARGAALTLGAELLRLGCRRPLILTDRGVRSAGLLEPILESLEAAGVVPLVHDAIDPEPAFTAVTAANEACRSAQVDAVVALGGGSVMDTAKLVAATLSDGRSSQDLAGIGRVQRRALPLVCLPTTAGTGSEATPVAIFTDLATGTKVGVVDPCLVPDVVLLDPALTDRLPLLPTAAAGMDALVHALEAYIAKVATPLARGLALEAASHIGPALPAVCGPRPDPTDRDAMLIGAHLAGMAFAHSSCCGVHALALPLGGRFHIPHGVLTGNLVGETMRFNLPACSDDLGRFAGALGWELRSIDEFPERLNALARDIGLVAALRSVPVPAAALPELVRAAVAIRRLMDPNPRAIGEGDAALIYRRVLQPQDAN